MSRSWQPFVDELLMCEIEGCHLTSAAIVGHDGTVWAQSAAFPQFRRVELANIMKDFSEPGHLTPTGLFLGSMKYIVIQGEPGAVIRGKKVPDILHRLWFVLNCFVSFNLYDRHMPLWNGFYYWSRVLVKETIAILEGSGGITVVKTGMGLVIGIYDQPMTPRQCNLLVESLGTYSLRPRKKVLLGVRATSLARFVKNTDNI